MHVARTGTSRRRTGLLSLILAAGVVGGLLVPGVARADSAPTNPADPATPATVTADALPTVQINGVAWSQAVVGNTVYVAGNFTSARPAGVAAGTQETARKNLLAYDITTGALITSFAPSLNGQALVVTASPDGSRIYVGGDFTTANGQARNRVAAYDTATGALVSTFKPSVNGQVRTIAATNATVYLGGGFSAVGSVGRNRLAAVKASDGSLLPWAPQPGVGSTAGNRLPLFDAKGNAIPGSVNTAANARTSNDVMALVVTGGGTQVVAGGRFDTLNGVKSTGVGALDATTGATRPFAINQLITNQGVNSAIYSLSTDGTTVYGSAYDYYGPGNLENAFAAAAGGGAVTWIADCRGDTYSTFPMNGALYESGHAHNCANIGGFTQQDPIAYKYATAMSLAPTGKNAQLSDLRANTNFVGQPSPSELNWYPSLTAGTVTGAMQAAWSVSGNGRYVVYGGEFPKVNGTAQQGLVRFAVRSIAPNRTSPTGGGLTPTVDAVAPGTARVTWRESYDLDSRDLIYRVYRDNGTAPVYETTASSTWYDMRALAFTDTGLSAGTHTYRVGVVDPTGNKNTGSSVPVSVPAGTSPATRGYAGLVAADGALDLWSLGEAKGATTAQDAIGGYDLKVNSGVTLGQPGAIAGDADTAASFNGSTSGYAGTQSSVYGPQAFSVEAWFQTTTKSGGRILGFGSSATGTSYSYDRLLYMAANGQVNFGVWPSSYQIATSPTAYNDGRWHHAVGTMGPAGVALYLDGKLVATNAGGTAAQPYYGYWRIGGDATWSGAQYFTGKIDEVAVYPGPLTASQVATHFTAGSTGAGGNRAPAAAFTSSVSALATTVDGSSSTDPDGTVTGWAWNFGDGGTATGPTASHTYAAGGTYAVTLTVTDNQGAVATRTQSVTVTAPLPNKAPTAAFTVAAAGRTGTFDGSGSTDTDGTVASWAWSFGDGGSATGAKVSHVYGADGTYPVTLTVTDDDGAAATTTQKVTVTAATLASDAFNRVVSGGLGVADVGGSWTASAGAARQSVASGTATLALPSGGLNTGSYLGAVQQTAVDLQTTVALSAAPTGGGLNVGVVGRRVGTNAEYRARLRFLANGSVAVGITDLPGTATETLIGKEAPVAGLTYAPGTKLQVHLRVTGTNGTTLAVTVWPAGTAEPATPTVTVTDSTPVLQAAGGVGVTAYLSSSATAPVDVLVGSLAAKPV